VAFQADWEALFPGQLALGLDLPIEVGNGPSQKAHPVFRMCERSGARVRPFGVCHLTLGEPDFALGVRKFLQVPEETLIGTLDNDAFLAHVYDL
jgi:hypothetical protein